MAAGQLQTIICVQNINNININKAWLNVVMEIRRAFRLSLGWRVRFRDFAL